MTEIEGDCTIWNGAVSSSGYGSVWVNGRGTTAHRAALAQEIGWDALHGMDVRHLCHVRLCVNPAHLAVGTRQENVQDSVVAGRTSRGEGRPMAKLTDGIVREARRLHQEGASQRSLAKRYGVSQDTMWQCLTGKTWSHVIQ